MFPALDATLVRQWAIDKTPVEFRDQMRVEVDETRTALIILECRPPWSEGADGDWTRMPIARLSFAKSRNEWALYWADRNSRFRQYTERGPTSRVGDLLDEIDADPTCIFWG